MLDFLFLSSALAQSYVDIASLLSSSYQNLADQIHKAGRLPTTRFIFPSAESNKDAGERAWYIPVPVQDSDPQGDLSSYEPAINTADELIKEQEQSGIPRSRIVLGGFSQGSAITALWSITRQKTSSDRIAGLALVAGYVPMRAQFDDLIQQANRETIKDQPMLVVHGQDDTLIQPWVMKEGIPVLEKAGFDVTWALLPDMRHNVTGHCLAGLCKFLQDMFK